MKFQHASPFNRQIDFLGAANSTAAAGQFTTSVNITALNPYTALAVVASVSAGQLYYVQVTNISSGGNYTPAFGAPFAFDQQFAPFIPCRTFLPIACNAGDTLVVTVLGSTAAATYSVSVFGYASLIPPPYRNDGRAYPIGLFCVTGSLTASNGPAVITTPPGNARVMIKTVQIDNEVANSQIQVTSTISGVANSAIANLRNGTNTTWAVEKPTGVLCDRGAVVNMTGGAAPTGQATVTFDFCI